MRSINFRQCSWWRWDTEFFNVYTLFVHNTTCQINRCPRHPNVISAEIFESCILLPDLYFSVLSLARYFFIWCGGKKINKLKNEALSLKTYRLLKLESFPKDTRTVNSNSGYFFSPPHFIQPESLSSSCCWYFSSQSNETHFGAKKHLERLLTFLQYSNELNKLPRCFLQCREIFRNIKVTLFTPAARSIPDAWCDTSILHVFS